MQLGVPFGPERLLAARALLVTRSILLWIVQSLLSELLFTNSSVLRLLGVHRPCVLLAFGRTVLLPFDRLLGPVNTLVLQDVDLLLMRGLLLLAGVACNGLLA
jgi:hypothetical protein